MNDLEDTMVENTAMKAREISKMEFRNLVVMLHCTFCLSKQVYLSVSMM